MKITYNKLVRDLIPQIIEKSGKTAVYDTLSDEAYLEMLDKKLVEEINEYQSDKNLEELADILEVVYAIAEAKGSSAIGLEKLRAEKAVSRGGFKKKILLKEVIEK